MKNYKQFKKIVLASVMGISVFSIPAPVKANSETKSYKQLFSDYLKSKLSVKETVDVETADEFVRVIVQVNGKSETVKNSIKALIGDFSVKHEYDKVFNGFSFDVQRKYIPEISQLSGVKKLSIARLFTPQMSDATALTQAMTSWNNNNYKGEGMVVSIIDTGIDVTHKDMRIDDPSKVKIKSVKTSNETAYTLKVPYGYNYADGNDIVTDSTMNGKSMHGMHVAGIVAANATDEDIAANNGFDGVAPEAQLLAMKVFSNASAVKGASEDAIVKAIEDSVKLGADVINMSLGADNGFSDESDPEAIAIQKARDAGVVVVVAAGNAALNTTKSDTQRVPTNDLELTDNAIVGSPSTAQGGISVASSNNLTPVGYFGNVDGQRFKFTIATKFDGFSNQPYEAVNVGLGRNEDYNNADGTRKDLTGKIAFIRRGEITFAEKYENAIAANAAGIIVANNREGSFGMAGVDGFDIAGITISKDDGDLVEQKIADGHRVKISKDDPDYDGSNELSAFTSWGPTPSLEFKPEITAPGGNIKSTLNNNEYGNMSGTSMATPHVSGAIALIKGATQGKVDLGSHDFVYFAKRSLINTAKPFNDIAGATGLPVSPRRQGAGLIQIADAIKNRVLVTDDSGNATVALKEISGQTTFNLTLENLSDEEVSYDVEFSDVLTEQTDSTTKEVRDIVAQGASIRSNVSTINVAPKSTQTIQVTLDTTNAAMDQFMEGFIQFKSKNANHPSLNVPYVGFNGDWGKQTPFDVEKDVDADGDDKYDGVFNKLGLTSSGQYLGSDFTPAGYVTDINKAAISPNGDESFDSFTTNLGLLRNISTLDIDIVKEKTENAESLVHLETPKNIRRGSLMDNGKVLFAGGNWDGKVFNSASGNYDVAEDGQYYVRLRAEMLSTHTSSHYKYLPVYVDTKQPTINIISKEDEGNEYVVKFTVDEQGSGLLHMGVNYIVDKGSPVQVDPDNQGVYTARIPHALLRDGKNHTIALGATDFALNVGVEVIHHDAVSVFVSNVKETVNANSADLNESGYNFVGRVANDISKVRINGVEVDVNDDRTFEVRVPLNEGRNTLTVNGLDAQGNVVSNELLTMIKDTTAPTINITNFNVAEIQKSVDGTLRLVGNVSDNLSEVKLKVSGKEITVDNNGNFDTVVDIDSSFVTRIEAIDKAGNRTIVRVKTAFNDETSPVSIKFESPFRNTVFLGENSSEIKDGKYTISGVVTRRVAKLMVGDQEIAIGEDQRFDVQYPINEGTNKIQIVAYDEQGAILYENSTTVHYDRILPTLDVDLGYVDENNVIYTNKNPFEIEGSVSDNGFGHRLRVNGNEVVSVEYASMRGEDALRREFSQSLSLNDNDTLLFELEDAFGNRVEERYTIRLDQVAPEITVTGIENDILTLPNQLNVSSTEDGTLEVSVDGEAYDASKQLTLGEHLLVAVAKDRAGNMTRKEVLFTVKDTYAVVENNEQKPAYGVELGKTPLVEQLFTITNSTGEQVAISQVVLLDSLPSEEGTYSLRYRLVLENGETLETAAEFTFVKPKTLVSENGSVHNILSPNELGLTIEKVDPNPLLERDATAYVVNISNEDQFELNTNESYDIIFKTAENRNVKAVYTLNDDGELVEIAYALHENGVSINNTALQHSKKVFIQYVSLDDKQVSNSELIKNSSNKELNLNQTQKNAKKDVETSDASNTSLYFVIMIVAGLAIVSSLRKKRN